MMETMTMMYSKWLMKRHSPDATARQYTRGENRDQAR